MMKNTVFNYDKKEIIGLVNSVDTGMSTAVINDDSTLSQLQVNQLLAVQSPKSGRFIIAMIIKIYRKASNIDDEEETEDGASLATFNQVRLVFVGEFIDKIGTKTNVFRRNVSAVPSIDAPCYKIEHERLTNLMQSISSELATSVNPLQIGNIQWMKVALLILTQTNSFNVMQLSSALRVVANLFVLQGL